MELKQQYLISKRPNRNKDGEWEWCVCLEETPDTPLVFGNSLKEAVQNFYKFIEKED